jgi:hypothetical protein
VPGDGACLRRMCLDAVVVQKTHDLERGSLAWLYLRFQDGVCSSVAGSPAPVAAFEEAPSPPRASLSRALRWVTPPAAPVLLLRRSLPAWRSRGSMSDNMCRADTRGTLQLMRQVLNDESHRLTAEEVAAASGVPRHGGSLPRAHGGVGRGVRAAGGLRGGERVLLSGRSVPLNEHVA